jgi:type IV pilus assembly protein PilB
LDNLKKLTGCEINLVLATRSEILKAIDRFYFEDKSAWEQAKPTLQEAVKDTYLTENIAFTPTGTIDTSSSETEIGLDSLITKAKEAPVVKLVDLIIRQAIDERASDIHIEPYKDKISLRYRIDGSLYEIPPPARHLHLGLVSRIKILSKLDIAEKRIPQDGAISAKLENRVVDLRISTVPTIWGEKVVMRILDKFAVPLDLPQLGFDQKQLDAVRKALKRPYGLFFVTGPTGSGKSTTLYACLNETIDPRRNIITCEDPVEFRIEGINQVNVKPDIGLTFATALRAFLRQDPDIIMVGEVRDLETAQICVRAALTGHFVLSTLHTNDAASAITRLMDIGIEPYLLTPSLVLVLAQRLARKLCSKCKEPYEPRPEQHGGLTFKSDLIYRPKGCEECNQTGYRGRLVVAEVLSVDDNIRELISNKASYSQIKDTARKNGMDTLFESGIKKVEAGITGLDEILSIAVS